MGLATLNDVFADQIEDLYSAETQLVEALPKIAAAASDAKLREAIENHLRRRADTSSGCRTSRAISASTQRKSARGWPA